MGVTSCNREPFYSDTDKGPLKCNNLYCGAILDLYVMLFLSTVQIVATRYQLVTIMVVYK